MENPSYEEKFAPVTRWLQRLRRAVCWHLRGALGLRRKLLVELRWRLGDEIMALPVLHALRQQYPFDLIEVWTNYPDLFRLNPEIDIINGPGNSPDRYLLLRGAPRDTYRPAHYASIAGIRGSLPRPALHFATWDTPLLKEIPRSAKATIALAPQTTWPTKTWPKARWTELTARLADRGATFVELGVGEAIIPNALNLCGRTSVRDAACVLRHVDLLIACDNGLLHLALASGTQVLGLYGATDPDFYIRDEPRLLALRSKQPCSGFWNHTLRHTDPSIAPDGSSDCLADIQVDEVLAAVLQCLPAMGKP